MCQRYNLVIFLAVGCLLTVSIPLSAKTSPQFDYHKSGIGTQFPAQEITSPPGKPKISTTSMENRRQCASLVRIRELQGELYLGHIIQEHILSRNCPGDYYRFQGKFWKWPWQNGRASTELPPYQHAQFGDWAIRCGLAGRDRRCIVVHHATSLTDDRVEIVTHFVFHKTGQNSELVWRIWAPKLMVNWYAGRSSADNRKLREWSNKCQHNQKKSINCQMQSRFRLFKSLNTERVIFQQSGSRDFLKFNPCQKEGCMAEASGPIARNASNALIKNEPITVTLHPHPNYPIVVTISAEGFSKAMTALGRLWLEDQKLPTGSINGVISERSANY